jgi:hypothetical protein
MEQLIVFKKGWKFIIEQRKVEKLAWQYQAHVDLLKEQLKKEGQIMKS